MKNNKDDNKLKAILSTICVLIVIGAIAGVVYLGQNNKEEKELAYTELIHDVNNGEIEKIKMTTGSTTITVTYKTTREGAEGTEENEKERQKGHYSKYTSVY